MAQGKVPIIDLARPRSGHQELAKEIGEACEKVGFFIIVNHSVPRDVIDEAFLASREFFDMPVEDKKEVSMSPDYMYGYEATEILSNTRDPETTSRVDLKETFQVCLGSDTPDADMIPPRWPSKPSSLRPALTRYYRELEKLASRLLKLFALALDLPEDWFEDKIDKHMSSLRILNYPSQEQPPLPGQLRASAHADYGSLTILRQDDAPGGLQVLNKDGSWQDVSTKGLDAFIINLGDLMARWTNDKWVSTVHRVVNPPVEVAKDSRRQSMAFFHNINRTAMVETIPTTVTPTSPLKYEPIMAGDYLVMKHTRATTY